MDSKTKQKIIQACRKISRWNPARQNVKKACKLDKALFQCSKCGNLCYEGKSSKTFKEYQAKYAPLEVRQEFLDIDHISTVVPLTGWDSWDGFIERLFCGEENLRGLCSTVCHAKKTKAEKSIRLANKYGKK